MSNALLSFLGLLTNDADTIKASAKKAFAKELAIYVHSNNRTALALALATANAAKGEKAKALGLAIALGVDACVNVLPDNRGHIGATIGAYAAQPVAYREAYEAALLAGLSAFEQSFNSAEFLKPKATKSKEEKEQAKADKASKEAEALESLVTAKVQAGELVRACDVRDLSALSAEALVSALVDALAKATLDDNSKATLENLVGLPTLRHELALAKVELSALASEAKAKATKPKKQPATV